MRNLWAALLAALGFALRRLDPAGAFATSDRVAPAIAAAGAVATVVMAWTLGVHIAAGADSYGYVSESELIANGQLYVDQPLIGELPADLSDGVLAPLGYTPHAPSGVRGRIVPTYSPGLPIVMAGLRLIGGPEAVYAVVPLLAGLTVWLTFVLGRELFSPALGLVAMLWLITSPSFVNSSLIPMSDVPVTAWWLAAFVAALRPSLLYAVAAGLATSLAVLTRPNLAPLAIFIAVPFAARWLAARDRPRTVEAVAFCVSAAIGPLTVALLFNYWYGSPFLSGYGPAQSALLVVVPGAEPGALSALVRRVADALHSGRPCRTVYSVATGPGRRAVPRISLPWLMLAFAALVWGSYLRYFVFEAWWYSALPPALLPIPDRARERRAPGVFSTPPCPLGGRCSVYLRSSSFTV